MDKKTANMIGIIVGIVIIIIGFCVQGTQIDSSAYSFGSGPEIGKSIKFGADFYTEMYDVTKDVGLAVNSANRTISGAVNHAQSNICTAMEQVCDAIGWLIVVVGLLNVCHFLPKVVQGDGDAVGIAEVPSVHTIATTLDETRRQDEFGVIDDSHVAGGWTCTCGRNHAAFESSCLCGMTKADAKLQNMQNG